MVLIIQFNCFFKHLSRRLMFPLPVYVMACLMLWSCHAWAEVLELSSPWYQAPEAWRYQNQTDLAATGLRPVNQVNLTGGHFWKQVDFPVNKPGRYVLDFKNTSIIGHFRHIILDTNLKPIADMQGGIQNTAVNPFFLRHGREIELSAGRYRLLTELSSVFFLAEPQPYLDTLDSYQQAIKPGNTVTLICLGMFLGLMIYYLALGLACFSLSSAMYALFILGNFLFNGTGLLVFPDLFGMHWIYLASVPILFSNCAYVLFVMTLLKIRRDNHPRLYLVGVSLILALAGLIVLAFFMPHWSLEIDRFGVGLFLMYGLVAGLVRSRKGSVIAQLYLAAIGTFFVLGGITISSSSLSFHTIYIEHLGLISVAVEVMLLALVLTHQFTLLYREKEDALERMEQSIAIAYTDALTGLPNRMALNQALDTLPQHGSLTFIDMDGLKQYNDQFGHECGDELLRSFAKYMTKHLSIMARAYRLGGDEFAITCESGDVAWIEKMLVLAVEDLRNSGFESADASSGSVHVHEAFSKEELKHTADCRMYENKRRCKNSPQHDWKNHDRLKAFYHPQPGKA